MKRVEIDGLFYRWRRGKLVQIPPKWVGRIPTPQTIRNRKKDARVNKNNLNERKTKLENIRKNENKC